MIRREQPETVETPDGWERVPDTGALQEGTLQYRVLQRVRDIQSEPNQANSRQVTNLYFLDRESSIAPTLSTLFRKGYLDRRPQETGTDCRYVYRPSTAGERRLFRG